MILSLPQLVAVIARERQQGRTIALANGCFDLLHAGHVRYLQGAAREADGLVVGINDDESVRELKGEGRPILTASARAELVDAIRGVSFVVIFHGLTVAPVIEAIHPDVHCKGTDYTVGTVPERDIVRAYGGRVAIVGDPKDHSTRELVTRIIDALPQRNGNAVAKSRRDDEQ
jgi:D-glycero-beta-D-manno-heptose 1-phosphate adenylyltransferase